jgi:1,4-alpha-glucan branching enzyme
MSKLFILTLVVFLNTAFSQVVSTEPPFATRNDSIVVIFNAAEGDAGLKGYNGADVYAHTGVTIEGEGIWKYVIADWPVNLNKAKLSKIGTDLWELVIGNPYQYYSVPAGKKITQLSFVFRNSDGSVTGRAVGGADIFLDLFEPGLTMTLDEPTLNLSFGDSRRSPIFTTNPLAIRSIAATLGTQILFHDLYQNNVLVASTEKDTLEYTYLPFSDSGMQIFKIVGTDTSGVKDSLEFAVMVTPDAIQQTRPQGIENGINYIDENTVILSLFAPYKSNVFLLGDFNDWLVDEKYMMKKDQIDGDNIYWWIQLDSLMTQTEYAFQYLVDGELRIADPYTEKVLDPWNDKWISSETYPALKPYPAGKTDKPTAILQTGLQEYQWQTQNYVAPKKDELIVYELLVRDFVAKHDYKTLIDTLDYLQNLGINAIELMPVNEFEGNESWGYNPSFYFALDKYYGTRESFKTFVDSCHARGIAVLIDLVFNHSSGQSPFVQLYLDYYGADEIVMQVPNPWFNRQSPNQTFKWDADFNHESKYVKELIDRVTQYWLTEYKVDGFRFDFTKGFTNVSGDGGAYDASRISILKRMTDAIWAVNPNAYVTIEHLTANSEEKELADYGLQLWGNMNYNYNEATMGYNESGKSDFSWGYYKERGWAEPNLVTYMESHDEERLMFKNLTYGNSNGNYNVKELSTALQRIKMANTFFLTLPGPKMMWMGGELGYEISIDDGGRVSNKPFKWNYLQDTDRKNLYNTYAELLKLRKNVSAFRDPNATVDLAVSGKNKRIKISDGNINISIVGNFDVVASEINPSFHNTGMWYDYFSGDSLDVVNATDPIALAPGEFHIYTDIKLDSPDDDPVTALEEVGLNLPRKFELGQNYPNPFNPVTAIRYSLASASYVQIIIFDIQGRRVKTLVNKKQNPGNYMVNFSGVNLSSGTYFYTFQAGSFVKTRKMVLIK